VRIFNRLLIFLDVRATSQPLAVAGLAAGYSASLCCGPGQKHRSHSVRCGSSISESAEFRVRKCHSKLRYVGLPKFTAASRGTPCDSVASCWFLALT